MKVKVVKNKVAPPFRQQNLTLCMEEGVSKIGEILDLGRNTRSLRKVVLGLVMVILN